MRLIDADKLEQQVKEKFGKNSLTFRFLLHVIQEQSTVEKTPMLNGRWIEHYSFGAWHYDCPFCDDGYATKERQEKPQNYCHNCGARLVKTDG